MHALHPVPCLAVLAALALAPAAVGQVPDGSYVVSSLWTSAISRGPGGLFVVHPRVPGPPIVVQGLGPDLRGTAAWSGVGASAVAVRPDDGALLVGEIAPAGVQVDLHEITLSGATVANDRLFPVGTAGRSGSGGIAKLALMPDGGALIAVRDIQAGPPLNGAMLAIVSRTGAVTPVPTQILNAEYPLALAVDPSGTTAYLVVGPIEPHAVHLYAVPLPAGGTARLVATFRPVLTGLAFDSRGDLIACSTTDLYAVDTARGTLRTISTLPAIAGSLDAELATGGFALIQNGFAGAATGVHHVDVGGTITALTSAIPGVLSDVAVLANPRTYGAATPGAARYDWQVAPAPGGLPRLGNRGFALQVTTQGGPPTAGALVAGLAAGSFRIHGVDVLLDPASMFAIGSTTPNGSYPLPIPLGAPAGATLFVQSFHLDAGAPAGVAATNGQRLTILR